MRGLEPQEQGFVERNGARVGYEVFGEDGRQTLLLMPPYCIVHSRIWKMQVPYLATGSSRGTASATAAPTDHGAPSATRPRSTPRTPLPC